MNYSEMKKRKNQVLRHLLSDFAGEDIAGERKP